MKLIGQPEWMSCCGKVEKEMHVILSDLDCPNLIREAMGYSLFAGGKRIRPVLMMQLCCLLGGREEDIMPLACALEMIHSYSLIHDDLPAMDNDVLRRGKPTNHVVYGEAQAILAGDGLSNLAYEVILHRIPQNNEIASGYLKAAAYLSRCAGVCGMGGGQCMDLLAEKEHVDLETLTELERLKTGALLRASLVCAAFVAGRGDLVGQLERYGDAIGLLFQIQDDILDAIGSAVLLGKSTGKDAQAGKTTFVSALGIDGAKSAAKDYRARAEEALNGLPQEARDYLKDLTEDLLERDH